LNAVSLIFVVSYTDFSGICDNFLLLLLLSGFEWHLGVFSAVVRRHDRRQLKNISVWRIYVPVWRWTIWSMCSGSIHFLFTLVISYTYIEERVCEAYKAVYLLFCNDNNDNV